MSVTVTKDRTAEVLAAIRDLTKTRVMVGIPASSGRSGGDGIDNATIGYIAEVGAPERNIPARPHLVPGVESIRPQAIARLKAAGQAALAGDQAAVEKAFHVVGILAQNAVRAEITDGTFAPLAPRTLAARRARGRQGDKPLIDTGQLRRAYTYTIVRKG